ncbi:acyl-phosphate glycerol 3-phosphate acyltransferase [candidate division WOR-1 bacterium RIFOXYA12_FULL_43_27]|uniref:Glycerol-3-phosphate acyltransferase n=1 Tax=candidate division WOR-1 bacterium RIFOXYC2_FULL_46_14 TaxID=1802587 RepID=A0A1F4U998_UNCSA|nr:MAG: acyl-phosphate glycerol 3-phosphate acyltransferase [candidate division WOR-1 bacterium RIFOXYA12_FULL_43_27]OGC19283.1 MAG: acyl-phosphate glycerol 3-phosphate acyltransferase [candidate division WOR-1 bacterium RIFOXYB2_FULL_46_45]OGC30272.1 MAG: acyl-phosphate glycerol 3-phosphate acyltransferase [candidate division WOR-1 bacterium RIFOXYA2_FULL_46_56]OGC40873.1 MAG: acyl-phosphate glycerol 3-phosphate acyltransferase [candidate division WOR-1 bacterium RIFOXYC2_FULL_46_14]
MQITLILAASYLLGSIPFGYIIGLIYGKDLTKEGSGNIGATNTFRTLGIIPGSIVFFFDLAKGALAVLLCSLLYPNPLAIIAAGAIAIAGHTFSVFMGFKGGKGVATGLGVLFGIAPEVFLICLVWTVVITALTRYVSVTSITGAILATSLMFWFGKPLSYSIFVAIASAFIIYKHKDNIKRLLDGTENRIGGKKKNAV